MSEPNANTLTTVPEGGLSFEVTLRRGAARTGTLVTAHGPVQTPAFVAVGTQAAVKGLTPGAVVDTSTQLLFANTYHLYLRPGADVVAAHGGLHRFMGWDGPILTDSGGFQVFSLGASIEHGVGKIGSIFPGEDAGAGQRRLASRTGMVKVDEDGVEFRSHIDGSKHRFDPETSIGVQRKLGADIVLAFDECTSPLHDEAYTRKSLERTHRWARRSLAAFKAGVALHGYPQALYGIVQGGAFEDQRVESAQVVGGMGFDGIAIGGNLGSTRADMYRILDWTLPLLPPAKPRHLLGIGDVPSIFEAVARGIDTFDCVMPTRNARTGSLLVRPDWAPVEPGARASRLNIINARFRTDLGPIQEGCDCYTCGNFSRAYLRHLFKAGESLGPQLATVHNLRFMARLMEDIRAALREGTFDALWARVVPRA
ncbi:MAG: tRNA guanosine(34) transglycosylase Tgt [Truepera sp.]|jgi:tRNA-guanine transglycosylase|nr:tRNA guanosine(34) transglycosylase Tgt [Truepera sp.]HRN18616.1 tRNA guanosine(34) transglycosylase Tgt [Trueperaceae bacterium]HRQ11206.1 tRNA guanosine(34) transglycosylase Tgt [Trueperaceae bacterium]